MTMKYRPSYFSHGLYIRLSLKFEKYILHIDSSDEFHVIPRIYSLT
jgi:hypothetical protein